MIQILDASLVNVGEFIKEVEQDVALHGYDVERVLMVRGPSHMLDDVVRADDILAALPKKRSYRKIRGVDVYEYLLRDHPRKGGRCKWYTVNGQRVQGNLERRYAEALSKKDIEWNAHHRKTFAWVDEEGRMHWYSPDFHLPVEDIYVEVKGFWTSPALDKMERVRTQNPTANIKIVMEDEIVDLEK